MWPRRKRPRCGVDLANTGPILGDLADSKMGDLDPIFKIVTSRDLAPPFQGPIAAQIGRNLLVTVLERNCTKS